MTQLPPTDPLLVRARSLAAVHAWRDVLTALAPHGVQPQDVERSLAAGMDDHLSKPVTRERLAAVLERWVPTGSASA